MAGFLPGHVAWRVPHLWRWLRGCDRSLMDRPGTAFDLLAGNLNDEFERDRATGDSLLLGYSMGGRLALHLWLDRPELWRQVWIVSAHPGLEERELREERRVADGKWADLLMTAEAGKFLEAWDEQPVLRGSRSTDDLTRRRRVECWRTEMALALRHWSLGCQQPLGAEIARTLRDHGTELHWVTGSDDAKFTELARVMERRAPGLIRHEIPGVGHREALRGLKLGM